MTMAIKKWTEIESFHNLRRTLNTISEFSGSPPPSITYQAKVKLHGTNAAIQVHPTGEVFAQSRSRILSPEDDNMGFCKWVLESKDRWAAQFTGPGTATVYGEWCGKGIAKGVAISKIDRKIFAVFALQLDSNNQSSLITNTKTIRDYLWKFDHPDVYILPWIPGIITCDFASEKSLQDTIDWANHLVEHVEKCDPWVKHVFGIEGIGEGVVAYPVWDNVLVPRGDITAYMFKAKGTEHQVVKEKKAASLSPAAASSINGFADLVVTEARLDQGVTEACGGEYNIKKMGALLAWIARDIQKECAGELEASNLVWKQVQRPVSTKTREWYVKKIAEI